MKKHVSFDVEQEAYINIDFDCITEGCEKTFSLSEDYKDIYETVRCDHCGAEYDVYGDILDGDANVTQKKEGGQIDPETGEIIMPVRPAPNQIDMFLGDTYGRLRAKNLVS